MIFSFPVFMLHRNIFSWFLLRNCNPDYRLTKIPKFAIILVMLYFAYGMNTNRKGMAQRCPGALSLGHARLIDRAFRFANHADVVKCKDSFVDGVLWVIDDFHLNSLDTLEGYPYYYNRRKFRVAHNDRIVMAETYYMQPGNLDALPSQSYFDMVVEGYREHNVPVDQLYNSVYESANFA